MFATFAPFVEGRLNADFVLITLDGRAGVLSFGASRRFGFILALGPAAGGSDLCGGDTLPVLTVVSVFARLIVGRLSGEVRREISRDSGRLTTGMRLPGAGVRLVRYFGAMLAA